jgi:hypothetical protein
MTFIFWGIFVAAAVHVVEEYFFPGGFLGTMKDFQPRFAPFITPAFAIIINGLFLSLCLAVALAQGRPPLLGLSVAALVGLNGLMHAGAAARLRGYAPGVVSGVLLYLPLAVLAFCRESAQGNLTARAAGMALVLALLLQAVPIVYLGLARLSAKR